MPPYKLNKGILGRDYENRNKKPRRKDEVINDMEGFLYSFTYILDKPGSDLLSRALRQSTIGAERLNDRVRDGIGWGPLAITTRSMQVMYRIPLTRAVCVK